MVNSGAYSYFPQPMVPALPNPQMQAPYPHQMNLGSTIPSYQPMAQYPLYTGLNRRRVRVVQSEVEVLTYLLNYFGIFAYFTQYFTLFVG
jgi:hypothetical protein